MKNRKAKQLVLSAVATAAAMAQGQTPVTPTSDAVQPVQLESLKPRPVNRINVSYRMGLNITADFKKLGGYTAASNPDLHSDPNFTGDVRTYDQGGYLGVDSTGNNHGPGYENTTWYYGYQNASANQGNTLVQTSSSSPATASSKDNSDSPQNGFEISYDRELYQKGRWRFGVEGGLGYTFISIGDSRNLIATVNQITDTYAVPNGVVLPPAPYSGSYNGPGAVISSDPSRQTSVVSSSQNTIIGERQVEANVFSLRLGPYAEVPLNDKFSLLFSGGLYLAISDTKFSFRETVTIAGAGTEVHSGSTSTTDFLVGGYVGANLSYALTEQVSLFVGGQFQTAGETMNHAKGKESILNVSESVVVSIGASYSF
jgi:hypothetical protein